MATSTGSGATSGTVLIAYASSHGSTREVADRIAARLRVTGLAVDVADVDTHTSVDPYDAVVLGSAVQGAAWLPQAVQFAHRHREELAVRPVWLFSVGMHPAAGRQGGLFGRLIASAGPKEVTDLRRSLDPVDHRAFAGVLRPDATSGPERRLLRLLGGRFGDFRQWDAVDSWADGIARALTGSPGRRSGLKDVD